MGAHPPGLPLLAAVLLAFVHVCGGAEASNLVFRVSSSVGNEGACAGMYADISGGYDFFFNFTSSQPPLEVVDADGLQHTLQFEYHPVTHNCTEAGREAAMAALLSNHPTSPDPSTPGEQQQQEQAGQVHFLLGGFGDNAVADSLQSNGTGRLLVHCCAARASVYELELPHVYGVLTPATQQCEPVLRAMAQGGVRSLGVVCNAGHDYYKDVCMAAVREVSNVQRLHPTFQLSLVLNYTYEDTARPHFAADVGARLADSGVDALFLCDRTPVTRALVAAREAHATRTGSPPALKAIWLATNGDEEELLYPSSAQGGGGGGGYRDNGSSLEYALTTFQWTDTVPYADQYLGTAAEFAAAFKAATGRRPVAYGAAAVIAGRVLQLAVQAAVSMCSLTNVTHIAPDGHAVVDMDAFMWRPAGLRCYYNRQRSGMADMMGYDIVQYMADIMDEDTFFGHVHFDQFGQNIAHKPLVAQVLKNKLEVVLPLDVSTQPLVLPIPRPQPTDPWATTPAGIAIITLACCLAAACLAVVALLAYGWHRRRQRTCGIAEAVIIKYEDLQVDAPPCLCPDGLSWEAGEGVYRGARVKLVVAAEIIGGMSQQQQQCFPGNTSSAVAALAGLPPTSQPNTLLQLPPQLAPQPRSSLIGKDPVTPLALPPPLFGCRSLQPDGSESIAAAAVAPNAVAQLAPQRLLLSPQARWTVGPRPLKAPPKRTHSASSVAMPASSDHELADALGLGDVGEKGGNHSHDDELGGARLRRLCTDVTGAGSGVRRAAGESAPLHRVQVPAATPTTVRYSCAGGSLSRGGSGLQESPQAGANANFSRVLQGLWPRTVLGPSPPSEGGTPSFAGAGSLDTGTFRPASAAAIMPSPPLHRRQQSLKDLAWRAVRLQHRNICPIVGVVPAWPGITAPDGGPLPVVVRQWYEFASLADLLDNETVALPLTTRLQIATGVAEGLTYMHAQVPPVVAGPLDMRRILIDKGFSPHIFPLLTSLDPAYAQQQQAHAQQQQPSLSCNSGGRRAATQSGAAGKSPLPAAACLPAADAPSFEPGSPLGTNASQRRSAVPAACADGSGGATDGTSSGSSGGATEGAALPALLGAALSLMGDGRPYIPGEKQDVADMVRLLVHLFCPCPQSPSASQVHMPHMMFSTPTATPVTPMTSATTPMTPLTNAWFLVQAGNAGVHAGTNGQPSSAGSQQQHLRRHQQQQQQLAVAAAAAEHWESTQELLSGICPALAALVEACLWPQPEQRPTMAEVARRLEEEVHPQMMERTRLAAGQLSMSDQDHEGHCEQRLTPRGGVACGGGSYAPGPETAGEAAHEAHLRQQQQRRREAVAGGPSQEHARRSRRGAGGSTLCIVGGGRSARRLSTVALAGLASRADAQTRLLRHQLAAADDLLFDVFPPKVARALQAGESVEPERYDCVSIFFSDIVGYTDICAQLLPWEVMQMLHRLYSRLDAMIAERGLFKVETIGDAYMAVGNLRSPQPHSHALLLARFAFDAVRAATSVPVHPDRPELGHLHIRVGLHAGPVVASVVGLINRRYCLFGDTVNTASRMESNSACDRVHCSAPFAQLLREQGATRAGLVPVARGLLQVKGKGAMHTYWVEEREAQGGVSAGQQQVEGLRQASVTACSRAAAACAGRGAAAHVGIVVADDCSPDAAAGITEQ